MPTQRSRVMLLSESKPGIRAGEMPATSTKRKVMKLSNEDRLELSIALARAIYEARVMSRDERLAIRLEDLRRRIQLDGEEDETD